MGRELRRVLADGLDVGGTIEQNEVLTHVGSSSLEIIIGASDLEGAEQAQAYAAMCDLLEARLLEGCAQVMGCLLFAGDPQPGALVSGLVGMQRDSGTFTPVVPLARTQAEALAASKVTFDGVVDDVTALIEVAAARHPTTTRTAETLLEELDELIERRT